MAMLNIPSALSAKSTQKITKQQGYFFEISAIFEPQSVSSESNRRHFETAMTKHTKIAFIIVAFALELTGTEIHNAVGYVVMASAIALGAIAYISPVKP